MRNQYQILAEKYSAVNENELEEVVSKKKSQDMARVNAGAMSQAEFNAKYKRPVKKGLAGPGGLYKNLVKEENSNMSTGRGVADEFDSVLQAAGYPKSGYESAEIYNLIADYEKKVDPRNRNAHLYYSIAKALEWNEVDADLVADYLDDKAGASDNYHQDENAQPVQEDHSDNLLDAIKNNIDNVQSIEVQTHYGNKVLPIIEVWVQDGVLKLSVDHSAAEVDEGFYGSGSGRSRRPYADRNDESNLMYIYDSETGHLMKRMVSNMEEDSARAEGYRQSPEDALRAHGIMRSKFNPNKYVKHENGRWVEVFPYGKPEDKTQ